MGSNSQLFDFELVEDYLAQPPSRLLDALFQPFYDPLFGIDLPFFVRLLLVGCAIWIATRRSRKPNRSDSHQAPNWQGQSLSTLLIQMLASMPFYSILCAYIGTASAQTAIRSGFLRLPPQVREQEWYPDCRRSMMLILSVLNVIDCFIVVFSIVFSEATVSKIFHYINCHQGPRQKSKLRTAALIIAISQVGLWLSSYICVAAAIALLFAAMLVWGLAATPWILYSNEVYPKLAQTFVGKPLADEMKRFFVENQFLYTADQFRTFILPLATVALICQLNLMLCTWTLLIKTQDRLGHFYLLRHLDIHFNFSRFLRRRGRGHVPSQPSMQGQTETETELQRSANAEETPMLWPSEAHLNEANLDPALLAWNRTQSQIVQGTDVRELHAKRAPERVKVERFHDAVEATGDVCEGRVVDSPQTGTAKER